MKRKIELSATAKKKLAEHFNVSIGNVSLVLLFKRNSMQAERMRTMAYELGGRLVEMVDVTPTRTVKLLDSKGNVKAVKND